MNQVQQEICAKNRVYDFRKNSGLTQKRLAERIGVTRQTIGLIEQGKYNPSLRICLNLGKVLGATLDELFGDCIIQD